MAKRKLDFVSAAAAVLLIATAHSASGENYVQAESADGTLTFQVEVRDLSRSVQIRTQDGEVVLCLDTPTLGVQTGTTLVLPLLGRASDLVLTATSFRESGCLGKESAVGPNTYTVQVPPMSPVLQP